MGIKIPNFTNLPFAYLHREYIRQKLNRFSSHNRSELLRALKPNRIFTSTIDEIMSKYLIRKMY